MKKTISIILVLLMIFSMSAIAFALPDPTDEMMLGGTNSTPSWVETAGRKVINNGHLQ